MLFLEVAILNGSLIPEKSEYFYRLFEMLSSLHVTASEQTVHNNIIILMATHQESMILDNTE